MSLAIKNVEFTYPKAKKPTLQIDELTVQRGERVFIFGPSGSGKSTFLELIAGILLAQKGTVEVLGTSINALSSSARDEFRASHIGYIFQSFNLLPYLTVLENVLLPIQISRVRRDREKQPEIAAKQLLTSLGMGDFILNPVLNLSVGQQQRVAVARALLGQPEVILADEPTSALDQDQRTKFIETLFGLAKNNGTTVLFVSHDRSLEKLFDRSLDITKGVANIGASL